MVLGLAKVNTPQKQEIISNFKIDLIYNDTSTTININNNQSAQINDSLISKSKAVLIENKNERESIQAKNSEVIHFPKNDFHPPKVDQGFGIPLTKEGRTVKDNFLYHSNQKNLFNGSLRRNLNITFKQLIPEKKVQLSKVPKAILPKSKVLNKLEQENQITTEQKLNVSPGKSDSNVCTMSLIHLGRNLSGSFDPSDPNIKYKWQIISKPEKSQAVIKDANSQQPSFTPDIEGIYMIQLMISKDGYRPEVSHVSFKTTSIERGLKWKQLEGAIKYKIILNTPSNDSTIEIPIDASKTSYIFKNLAKNTVYNTTLAAFIRDESGLIEESPMTEVIQFRTCHDYNDDSGDYDSENASSLNAY